MIVEFVGEPKMGKSTASIKVAKSYSSMKGGNFIVIDTTPGMESFPVFVKEMLGEYNPFEDYDYTIEGSKYYNPKNMGELRNIVNTNINDSSVKSVIIDSSDYLLSMAVDEYLKETGHKSVYPPTEWRIVRQKVIDIFVDLMSRKDLLIVFTSPVKDEYKDIYDGKSVKSVKTGRKIPAGFEKLSYIVDVRIGIKFDEAKNVRIYKLMLSRFFDIYSADLSDLYYYGNDFDFDVFKKLITGKIREVIK